MGSTAEYRKQIRHSIPTDILDDLCSRFIINLPREDRGNLVRICFQIEQAHWFYLDYYCTDDTIRLYPCGIRDFAAHIFQHVPQLREHFSSLDAVLDNWREYKQMVPTYGAIILDTDLTHVLLVKSFCTKASWGFPKGKVNEDEEPWNCAAREVLEETGFDISQLINKDDYIERLLHGQIVRLYIIGYVPRDTIFQPRTRNEIKACEWFPLADLPANKQDMTPKGKMAVSPKAFYMVLPFVKRMRRWVAESNFNMFMNTTRTRHKSIGDIESSTVKNKYKTMSQGLQNEIQDYQQQNNYYLPKQFKNHGNWYGNNGNNQGNYHGNNQGNGPGNGYSNNYGNNHWNNHGNSHWNNYGNNYNHGNTHNYNHGNSHSYNHVNSHSYNHSNSHSYNHGRSHSYNYANNHNNNHNNTHWNKHSNGHFNNHGNGNIHNHNNGPINNHSNGYINNHNNGHIDNHNNGNWNNQDNNQINNHGRSHINEHGHGHINNHNNRNWNHGNSQWNNHYYNLRNQGSAAKITPNDTYKITLNYTDKISPNDTYKITLDETDNISPNDTYKITLDETDNISPNDTYKITLDEADQISPNDTYKITLDETDKITPNGNYKITLDETDKITPNDNYKITPNDNYKITLNDTNKITPNDTKKETNVAKRQLFTPQNTTETDNFPTVQQDSSPNNETQDENAFYTFVAPSWADFKFDKQAILDCFT